jgi:hypothetical protein
VNWIRSKAGRLGLDVSPTRICDNKCYVGMDGAVSCAARCRIWKSIINNFAAKLAMRRKPI